MENGKKQGDKQINFQSTEHTLFKKKIQGFEKETKNGLFRKIPGYVQYRFFVNERINSNGGMVNEGAQFYSIIKNKFNGRCTTILDNKGYSMGALVFAMGDKRVVTERADLMFHDYSSGLGGKAGEIQAYNEHSQKFIRKFFKEILLDTGFLSKKEFDNMLIGQDYWMDAEELCRRGIATHVLVNGKEIKAKKYLKQIKRKK